MLARTLVLLALVPLVAVGQEPPPFDHGLKVLPRDGALLLTVAPAKFMDTPAARPLLAENSPLGPAAALLDDEGGFDPRHLERASLYYHPDHGEPVAVLTFARPLDLDKLPGGLGLAWGLWKQSGAVAERKRDGCRYFVDESIWRALLVLDDRTLVLGSPPAVEAFQDARAAHPKRERLAAAFAAANENVAAAYADFKALGVTAKDWPAYPSQRENHLAAVAKTEEALLALDIGRGTTVRLDLGFPPGPAAGRAREALLALAKHAADVLAETREELLDRIDAGGKNDETRKFRVAMARFLHLADKPLRNVAVELPGPGRLGVADFHLDGPDAVATGLVFLVTSSMRTHFMDGPPVDPTPARLKRLHAALQAYERDHGAPPPAFTTDIWGRKLLSWRVLLLPYLGEEKLFAEFAPDEPWDGPTNRRLVARMPAVYAVGDGQGRPTTTLGAVVGTGRVLPPTGGKAVLLAPGVTPVPWSKPYDLPAAPTRGMGLLGDGTVQPLSPAPQYLPLPGGNAGAAGAVPGAPGFGRTTPPGGEPGFPSAPALPPRP